MRTRRELLAESVAGSVGSAVSVREWRHGVDFWADLAVTAGGPLGVLRSPRVPVVRTSYEGTVDFGDVIEREVAALGLMAAAGIPVPGVIAWRRDDPAWVLLTEVEHEAGAPVPTEQCGLLVRRLHDITPDLPALRPPGDWAAFFWARLRQRLVAAAVYGRLPEPDRLEQGALALLRPRQAEARSLLHMDLRAPNICVRGGAIVGLIDVANCLVGDPALELARIRSYGLFDAGFRRGYGGYPPDGALMDLYELDTAALLTVVAVEEFDDPELHRQQRARAEDLANRLAAA